MLDKLLKLCDLTKEEFLNGAPAKINCGLNNPKITISYDNGKVLIESSTYQSVQQYRTKLQGKEIKSDELIDTIDIIESDIELLEDVVKMIFNNNIITKTFLEEMEQDEDKCQKYVDCFIESQHRPMAEYHELIRMNR